MRLVGWQSATVEPGAEATVLVTTDPRLWRRWDEPASGWRQAVRPAASCSIARGLGDIRDSIDLL